MGRDGWWTGFWGGAGKTKKFFFFGGGELCACVVIHDYFYINKYRQAFMLMSELLYFTERV